MELTANICVTMFLSGCNNKYLIFIHCNNLFIFWDILMESTIWRDRNLKFETPVNGQAVIILTGLSDIFIYEISLWWDSDRNACYMKSPLQESEKKTNIGSSSLAPTEWTLILPTGQIQYKFWIAMFKVRDMTPPIDHPWSGWQTSARLLSKATLSHYLLDNFYHLKLLSPDKIYHKIAIKAPCHIIWPLVNISRRAAMTCDIAQGETSQASQAKKWKGVMVCDISSLATFFYWEPSLY